MLYGAFIWMRMILCVFLLPSPSHRIFLQTPGRGWTPRCPAPLLCLRDRVRLCHLGIILHTAMTGCLPPGGALLLLPRSLPTLRRVRIAQPGLGTLYPNMSLGLVLMMPWTKAARVYHLALLQMCSVGLLRTALTGVGLAPLHPSGSLRTLGGVRGAAPGLSSIYPSAGSGLMLLLQCVRDRGLCKQTLLWVCPTGLLHTAVAMMEGQISRGQLQRR